MVARIREVLEPFFVGPGGQRMTQDEISRQREIASALMQRGNPAFNNAGWLGAIGRGAEGLYSGWSDRQASQAEQTNATENQSALSRVLGSFGGGAGDGSLGGSPATSTSMVTAPAPDIASARVAQAFGDSTQPAGNLSESKQAFINGLLPAAMEESQRTGVDPRIIVAQAAQETGWGRSAPGNNYFGIKSHGQGGGQNFKTHEYVDGKRVNITDSFRRFDSPADSVRGYGDFILQNPRYGKLREAQGLDAQLAALQASGYATDPNYSRSVGSIARGITLPNAVAANEAMAGGDLAAQAVQNWAAQNYAPEGVTVAETPDQIMAAEQAMASPEFAAPPMAEPRMVQDIPVADIAASLTGANVNPDLPMMGGSAGGGFLPTQPQQPQQQAGGFDPELIQLLSSPYVDSNTRQIAMSLLGQQMQQADPMNQLKMQKLQAEVGQLQSGTPGASSSFGNLDAQARAAGLVPGSPEYQDFMLHGGGAPATFRALDMQARAAGLVPGSPEYNEFMATRGAGLQAGAAQTAKNVADIETGGAAAGAVDLGKASVKAGTEAWSDYGKLQTSIGNMDEAIAALDNGAQTGIIYKMLPNITEASASLQNAMDRMGLDVIGSVTFGALSEGEMRLAMQTAAPRDLPPAELRNWLAKKRDAQIKAGDMLADAAQFLTKPGNTINDWIERNRSAQKVQGGAGQSSTGIQWSIED